ncbi:hypothetical protein FNV43_RR16912 [Rhamnella rubrinervis]|uniref:Uncharacterized protein n=1 Tax=Rhamnella rubrinervis TaxID=2594499 RepID=A0A8K0GZN3_9ROSA|nr:hypothetical protein FNV43_RR16912 [Rhamnella rubrinervis]
MVRSMRGCPGMRANNSRTYTLIGFPLAFTLWGYKTIPPIAMMFEIKYKDITYPCLLNWITTGFATMKKLGHIFSKPNVISALEPTPFEMDFVRSIYWLIGRRPYDAPPIVEEKKNNDAAKESKRNDVNAMKKVGGKKKIHRDVPTASPTPHVNPKYRDVPTASPTPRANPESICHLFFHNICDRYKNGDDDVIGGDDYGMDHGGGDETINVEVQNNTEHVDTTSYSDVSRPTSPITLDHSI